MRLKKCIWIPSIIAIHREPFSKEEVNGYGIYIFLDCYISIALYFKTMSMGCDAQIDIILVKYLLCGCVLSLTLGAYWVDMGFINNYKKSNCD